ncbi:MULTISPECIES: hypothetical protein [unclassified Streptomyces]|uniref:hypothetical protein n=1 Tax=unclassified Streptomyces TaxID=2593676 RepID=UPI0022546875|nr:MULTISPECIES: hypothetical protein [unclassified Streptomyces]MCX4988767.1 hypothetical protein [Streptomyces sp. NBC_00568]MCX5006011.1 hypothetical protein [Streptomyces sp. NBC_00638]
MSWQSGDSEARPKVYLPQSDGETPPAYESYSDPAEAHGWRKAYADGDDTALLDPVPADSAVPGDPAGRHERLLRRRRARLTRRLAVAGGAACVVVLGVVVVGAFDSEPADGTGGTPVGTSGPVRLATGPAQSDEESADATSAQPSAATPSATPAAASAGASASASPGATTTAGGASTPSASTAPPASASPTATASATGGTSGGNGHGRGGGRHR